MTDSMKFGPEWLRNKSNDGVGGGGGGNGGNGGGLGPTNSSGPLGPRFQQAEYRYGREEMLSLYEKNLKLPEILPSFKKLFVDKVQLPLALSPSTDDELVMTTQQRQWVMRSPVSLMPTRGTGRGGSVDRGRGRSRGVYHVPSLSYPRPTAMYDEEIRGLGRGERGWPERNGGNEIGTSGGGSGDWNGSPSSSPRKEYSSHGRGSNMENWRRNRIEEDAGEGWRGGGGAAASAGSGSSYRWSRSTSWRDDESTIAPGVGSMPQITRSFSSSASVSNSSTAASGGNDRGGGGGCLISSASSGGIYKPTAQINSHDARPGNGSVGGSQPQSSGGGGAKSNTIWDQEDILPEWAMENATDGGGSFDASGAFVGPNDENNIGDVAADTNNTAAKSDRQRRRSSDLVSDGSGGSSSSGPKSSSKEDKLESTVERKSSDSTVNSASQKNSNNTQPSAEQPQQPLPESSPPPLQQQQQPTPQPAPVSTASQQHQIAQQTSNIQQQQQHISKKPFSDLSDRMQEVADDMVEKLIMDDELSMTMKTQQSISGIVPTMPVPLLKAPNTSSSPTDVAATLQRPSHQVHNHPMMVPQQSQPLPSNELWYYRDPQEKVQGPFSGAEMAEWYRSDYFDQNLCVRRVCDLRFATLGELVKMCGNSMPFLSSHLIPPLQKLPPVPMSNQPSGAGVVGVPGAQSINPPKPPSIGNPILGAGDVLTSLNMHLQCLQKDYLHRQQNMILSKLSLSEPFTLLTPEQKQQILNQQVAQVPFPDHIVNLQAFANFLYGGVNPSTYNMQQMMPGSGVGGGSGPLKPDLGPVKIPGAMHHPFMGNHSDYGPLHALMQGSVGGGGSGGGGGGGQPPMLPQQPIPQPPQQNADEPIKNLLQQLQMAKGLQQQSGAPLLPQHMGNKWPTNAMQPSQPQQGWPTGGPMAPVAMWDFDPLVNAVHGGIKPEMKTEQQILEEQRLQQQQQQQQQQHQLQQQQQQHQHSEALKLTAESGPINHQPQPSIPPILQPHLELQSQQHQQPVVPGTQQQRPNKKEERSKPEEPASSTTTTASTTTPGKLNKSDESKKSSGKAGKSSDKREVAAPKPKQTEEERKKELAEERRKQKEEKKRQQIEDERKRLQAQEDEKRRQMLEEKKRQEEIDHHRRAKMLENATPKPTKQPHESSGSSSRISSTSSIAPWSNTGLPGIAAPPASLAEIQKAERERRAEEQRLEQLMEHQRKSQQLETLVKADISLKWNAQPIKSVNVKSLAEIQAEEHKQQLAYEHAAAVAAADHRRLKDENERRFKEEEAMRRFKEEAAMLSISQSQSSFFSSGGGGVSNANGGGGGASGGGGGSSAASAGSGPGFGSIWSTRPSSSSFAAWNGKAAWSVAPNSAPGFWEQPTKTVSSAANTGTKQNGGGGGGTAAATGNRMLVKSQTISNIQTSVKNNHQAGPKQNAAKSANSAAGGKASVTSNQSRGGPNSGGGGGGQQHHNNGAGKDDARNEFTTWCIKALSSMKSTVDVPTFIGFLQDIESPYEVKDYIRMYLGETKECSEFGKQFLERRSKYKNQQRALNAHIDDMCSPAPAINPSSNDFQEVKGKSKKVKKNKMTKLDARILGFSVTAAQDRINVGDRDYGDAS